MGKTGLRALRPALSCPTLSPRTEYARPSPMSQYIRYHTYMECIIPAPHGRGPDCARNEARPEPARNTLSFSRGLKLRAAEAALINCRPQHRPSTAVHVWTGQGSWLTHMPTYDVHTASQPASQPCSQSRGSDRAIRLVLDDNCNSHEAAQDKRQCIGIRHGGGEGKGADLGPRRPWCGRGTGRARTGVW